MTTVPVTASALAVVVVFATWVAMSVTLPDVVRVWVLSPAIVAVVRTVGAETAASAVSERVEPDAPAVPASA
jgi:hypothetical protein